MDSEFPKIFSYGSIYNADDFKGRPSIQMLFNRNSSFDFEEVIRDLNSSASVLRSYDPTNTTLLDRFADDAEFVKEALVKSLTRNHPDVHSDIDEDSYIACATFLSNFLNGGESRTLGRVYSLNYDLLLYWTLMHAKNDHEQKFPRLETNDGFVAPQDAKAEYVVWAGERTGFYQRIFFLHGALHLFDTEIQVEKKTWSRSDVRLIDQTREALAINHFPIFVAEGESDEKIKKIRHNPYLEASYVQLYRDVALNNCKESCIFIFGHSLAATDDHILRNVFSGRLGHIFISLYGNPESETNASIKANVARLFRANQIGHQMAITYFDAASAQVWG